ncbi:hypothetical protein, partial [Nocardia alni]|uniref:hypothetical protein n=1 Tax=Nocardia alni TaxID=2815723 RepID=UPI0020B1EA0F
MIPAASGVNILPVSTAPTTVSARKKVPMASTTYTRHAPPHSSTISALRGRVDTFAMNQSNARGTPLR